MKIFDYIQPIKTNENGLPYELTIRFENKDELLEFIGRMMFYQSEIEDILNGYYIHNYNKDNVNRDDFFKLRAYVTNKINGIDLKIKE
jgi:hypothetical protein